MKTQAIRWGINGFLSLLAMAPLAAFALTPNQVFEKVKDSILVVKAQDTQGKHKAQGSGVMLPNGKVVTNCHVLKNRARFQVGRSEQFVSVTLYAEDLDKDLCLLEVKGLSAKPVQLGKAAALKVGEAVYAVGSPKGLELSLSDGIVSQLRGDTPPIIQTTAAISPGSSGGGLFDADGRLVGITTLYLDGGQSLNFAMPVEWLASIQSIKKQATKGRSFIDWLAQAAALEEKKDWRGMMDWCRQWSRADPGNAAAWVGLGEAYGNLNRYTDAIEAYREALRIKSDYAEAWSNLGVAYAKLNRNTEAIGAFREAVRIKPDDADTWYKLGVIYGKTNRYTDAIEAYREALRLRPDDADIWNNLGAAYAKLAPVSQFSQSLDEPTEPQLVAELLAVKLHTDQAIQAYREALRLRPEYAMVWCNLGGAYRLSWRLDEAIRAYEEAVRLDPKGAKAWNELGMVYAVQGQRGKVMEVYQRLRQLDPALADSFFNVWVVNPIAPR